MSQRLERLNQLLQIKEEATKRCYLELMNAKDQFNQNKARHDQLLVYRKDYVQQLEQIGNEGTAIGRLRNRIEFINHLDTALIQLNNHLAQIAKGRAKAEANYRLAKTSEEGVSKLIERVKKTELIKTQRNEQKESDEYAQKQWYSKNINDQSNPFGE